MGKNENIFTSVLFLALIFGLGTAFFCIRDRDFSENENRYLAQAPKLSVKKLVSGDYMEEADEYVSDQFAFRDFFMGTASEYRRLLGMRDIEDVYLARDGYLIQKTESRDVDTELVAQNISYINKFFEGCDTVEKERRVFLIVPTAAFVLEDKLPACAPEFDQGGIISEISRGISEGAALDASGALKSMEKQSFYKTDHHWTSWGAFEAYLEYSRLYGKTPAAEDFGFETVCTDFRGSLYSKVLLPNTAYDEIVLAKGIENITADCDGENGMLYDYGALSEKDKYRVFLGGNYGRVDIEGGGEGTLLLVKDSFANSFVPFLTRDYAKIIMLDMRYYMGSVKALAADEGVTDILVLYNTANFISDKNIVKLGL
ncbi:MAG: DHHW family protein [Butyrivibrio sp.]|nr:DHHW family protein [Butyrivibrio sp.]